MKLSYKLSYYVLYAVFAAIIVVLGLFYLGGEMADPIIPMMDNPANTDALLYLIYVILGATIAVTAIAFVFQFVLALIDNPANALKSLIGVIVLIAVLVITWNIGSGTELYLPGYDGTDNVPFWLKLTDMFLFSIYFLLIVTIVSIIGSGVKKMIS